MHSYLVEMLECPACYGELDWRIAEQDDGRVHAAEALCRGCGATYPVREGIGLFLTPDLPREDLWQQVDSQLSLYLREHSEVEQLLMRPPAESLNPADQFFRALVLEERGSYAEARVIEDLANTGLYHPEYLSCWKRQIDHVIERLSTGAGPVIDLASGRCYLVERMAQELQRPIVATDFSPRVLQRDRRWLQSRGLYEHVSLLAFDARRTPFKSGGIQALTTNLGLPNIRSADDLLRELRRVVAGTFLAISHFFPEDDAANATRIRELGLEDSLYRRRALQALAQAGWQVEVENACIGRALPTPSGVVLDGASIDSIPAAETWLEWCVLACTSQVS